jgi:hypothetical protein
MKLPKMELPIKVWAVTMVVVILIHLAIKYGGWE